MKFDKKKAEEGKEVFKKKEELYRIIFKELIQNIYAVSVTAQRI